EALITAGELLEPLLDLELLREDAFLDLQHLSTPVDELRVDLASQANGLLACLDLCLPAYGFAFAARILEQLVTDPPRPGNAGRAEDGDRELGMTVSSAVHDGNPDPDQLPGSSVGDPAAVGGTSPPAPGPAGSYP